MLIAPLFCTLRLQEQWLPETDLELVLIDGSHQHTRLWGQIRSPLGEDLREGKDAMLQPNPRRQMSLYKRELKNRLWQRETAK